jgi:hypothetical protein
MEIDAPCSSNWDEPRDALIRKIVELKVNTINKNNNEPVRKMAVLKFQFKFPESVKSHIFHKVIIVLVF